MVSYLVPRNTLLVQGQTGALENDSLCAFPCRCVAELQDKPDFSGLCFPVLNLPSQESRLLLDKSLKGDCVDYWKFCKVMFQVSQYVSISS